MGLLLPDNNSIAKTFSNSGLMELFLDFNFAESKQSREIYKYELSRFLTFIDNQPLSEINYPILQTYRANLCNYKPATISRILNILKSFFSFLTKIGYLKVNPAVLMKNPKFQNNSEFRYIRKIEAIKLLNVSKNSKRDFLIIYMLIHTGLRVSELANIKLDQFYMDVNNNTGLKIIGKGHKERHLKINLKLWQLIQDYKYFDIPGQPDPLFSGRNNQSISVRQIQRLIKKYSQKAGINEISPHWLRHTAATYAILGGASLEQVQQSLGHSSLTTTQRYLHSINELNNCMSDFINIYNDY